MAAKQRRAKGDGSISERSLWQFSLTFETQSGRSKRRRLYAKTKGELERRISDESDTDSGFAEAVASGGGSVSRISRWQYSLDVGKDKDGNRRRTYVYASSRAQLMRKVADERAKGGGTMRPRSRETITGWLSAWLEQKRQNVAPATFAVYETVWRVHLKSAVGNHRLDRFTHEHATDLYSDLRKMGVGGRTIQVAGKIMRLAFDDAIKTGKLRGTNPWRMIESPRHRERTARVLTAEEAQRFVKAARNDRYEAAWLLGLFGGLRIGECLGLKWCDVDLDSGEVRIRQQATEIHGRVEEGPLKTDSSVRDLVVGGSTLEALRRRRLSADSESHSSPFIFTSPSGQLLDRSNVRRRHFSKICEQAEIVGLRPHDLRHSMTSHAIKAGISPVVVARRLGHGSTRMTLDRYGHQLPGQQREAAATLEAVLDIPQKPASNG